MAFRPFAGTKKMEVALPEALPLLPTTVVGSYALPSWIYAADDWMQRGLYGPIDTAETFNDAVDRAILDQEKAGVDIISDGEMRRRGFVQGFVHKISGLKNVGAPRKVGESGIDQEPVYETTGPVTVGNGIGIVEEFEYLAKNTKKQKKVALPGAFAITAWYKPVEHYKDRTELAWAFVPALKDEIKRLAAAGATYIQIDEPIIPGYGADHHTPQDLTRMFNECIAGVSGVTFGMHICFGTHKKIAYAKRTYAPYFPAMLDAKADQFMLEFANREMSEVERMKDWLSGRDLVAGVVDVRNHYIETPEDVAERIRALLKHFPAERLYLSPDCGMRRVIRYRAFEKLKSLVEGARIVRRELTGKSD
jgi:5-methyltetrahydropteroyltriglutamate--homocysteine methyltransferase